MKRTPLSANEQETVIVFNKGDDTASVFTYEGTWQRHMETRLGLKPVMDNGFGGKEYQIDKKRIPMPKAPRTPKQLTDEQRRAIGERLARSRAKQANSAPALL